MTIAQRMFNEMEKRGIKPIELARYLGINKSVVSTWKSRGNAPPTEYVVQICELLNISYSFFLRGEEDENQELNDTESTLLKQFRYLDPYDQMDVSEIVDLKYRRAKEKESSFSDQGGSATA